MRDQLPLLCIWEEQMTEIALAAGGWMSKVDVFSYSGKCAEASGLDAL